MRLLIITQRVKFMPTRFDFAMLLRVLLLTKLELLPRMVVHVAGLPKKRQLRLVKQLREVQKILLH